MPKNRKQGDKERDEDPSGAWLPTRTGLTILAVVSLGLGGWTAWQISRALSLFESILWGIGFAASIWVVFGVVFLFNRWLRRG